ncbi:MAG: PorP/SprF family type IX secretion system membrane protein [Chitinophagaceae bacterium]
MSIKRIIYIHSFLLICCLNSEGQDINFSQFYELPMLRNPSLAGIFAGDYRLTTAYRNQWQSVTVPYRSFAAGLEYKKPLSENSDDFITMGIEATNDVAGDSKLSRTQAFPVINFHKSIANNKSTYLSAGIMGGPVFQRFDPSKLNFDDQFVNGAYRSTNPTQQVFQNTSLVFWDASAGLCFSSFAGDKTPYYIGLAMFHITQPKVAFQKQYDVILNRKWTINAGLATPVSEADKLIAYADYFMQGGNRQIQGGVMLAHDFSLFQDEKTSLSGGLFYRWKDAFIPVMKLDYYRLGIGMTYDINTSKLKTASQNRGGFELTLSYKAYRDIHNSSANKVKCPAF